jgi:RNase P subunit RPR2
MSAAEKRQWMTLKPHLSVFTCPICDKTTIPGLTSKVVLNHNHDTGRIYGWICDSCNTGLGRFKDDVAILEKAIDYLKTHS